ncbi:MAG: hypothetical protein ACKOFW_13340, partial [Planctomycetaceae bacterium]
RGWVEANRGEDRPTGGPGIGAGVGEPKVVGCVIRAGHVDASALAQTARLACASRPVLGRTSARG